MTDVVERLKRDFQDPDYRHVYDEGFLNSSLATQLKVLREERQWTQEQLATEAKMNQSRVSEMEDVNFNSWTIRTLRKFTRAFDLRLKISFEEFGTLLDDFPKLNRGALSRHSFKDDPAFKEPAAKEAEPEEALVEAVEKAVVLPPVTGLGLGSVDLEGIQQVRAAAATNWLKLAGYAEAHEGLASPGVLRQLAVLGLSQSPMSRILSVGVSDSTVADDSAAASVLPRSQDVTTSIPSSIDMSQPTPERAPAEWVVNPSRQKAA